eukprot:gene7380-515_t
MSNQSSQHTLHAALLPAAGDTIHTAAQQLPPSQPCAVPPGRHVSTSAVCLTSCARRYGAAAPVSHGAVLRGSLATLGWHPHPPWLQWLRGWLRLLDVFSRSFSRQLEEDLSVSVTWNCGTASTFHDTCLA